MKIYEVIKNLSISYCGKDMIATDMVLYKGDFLFIDKGCLVKDNIFDSIYRPNTLYRRYPILKRIYYNKTIITGVDKNGELIIRKEWTWINDLDILNPWINNSINIIDSEIRSLIKDVTKQWNRENIINEIINE